MSKPRCPWYSRAYGDRCDLAEGHEGFCSSIGDGFAPGWDGRADPPIAGRGGGRCPCGEDCEIVDYPTGVRSCGNVTP